jgi:GNAT superfamily N-acetyltransferase
MTISLVIRHATPSDRPQLRRAIVELQDYERLRHPTRLPGDQIADAYLDWMQRQAESQGAVLVAEHDGRFAGFVAGLVVETTNIAETPDSNRFGLISDICVMPVFRGQRIATLLLDAMGQYLGRAGVTRLRITGLAMNTSAQASYQHAGFVPHEVLYEKLMGAALPAQPGSGQRVATIRPAEPADTDWIGRFLRERWGASTIVVHGEAIDAATLPALVAENRSGLATWRPIERPLGRPTGRPIGRRHGRDAELVTLDAVPAGTGTGTALIEALAARLRAEGCARLWLTMTNANLSALRFYLRRDFRLVQVRPGAVDIARAMKPSIPLVGEHGIPVHDELDLCRILIPRRAPDLPAQPPWSRTRAAVIAQPTRATSFEYSISQRHAPLGLSRVQSQL